jgi:hypothetical protein
MRPLPHVLRCFRLLDLHRTFTHRQVHSHLSLPSKCADSCVYFCSLFLFCCCSVRICWHSFAINRPFANQNLAYDYWEDHQVTTSRDISHRIHRSTHSRKTESAPVVSFPVHLSQKLRRQSTLESKKPSPDHLRIGSESYDSSES